MTIAQPRQHLLSVSGRYRISLPSGSPSLLPPSGAQGCSSLFRGKQCRAHAVAAKIGGDVPDMETRGKQTSLSSAVEGRGTARGCKAKNREHDRGKPSAKTFSRPLSLTTGEPAIVALWALRGGIIPGPPSESNRAIQIKQLGGSQMNRLARTYGRLFGLTHLHDSGTRHPRNSQSSALPGADSQWLTRGALKESGA